MHVSAYREPITILRKTQIGLGPDGPEEDWQPERVIHGKVAELSATLQTNQQARRGIVGVEFSFRSQILNATYGKIRFRWKGSDYEPYQQPAMPGGFRRGVTIVPCTLASDPN